ncbi:response regulator [Paenibacillus sp. D2_2]|uniref:response regulator n=1 Tax=Paenibacillus sp. D2_2 TaxID=3073092 RepID=UPI0028159F6F|nr:response regulator [Paenibacillus sp. D2_2]WMT42760.1 response regulator [Paenibacillus sp. D2_2]
MYKLILADDEEDVREGLLDLIDWESIGYQIVDTAENGREAVDLIEKHVPDVVVTDIQMPFMDGLKLTEWIRQTHPATKVIILTGYEQFEYAQRAIQLDVNEYVLKPFSSEELAEVLRKVKLQIDGELEARKNVQLLTEHYKRNLPVLQRLFLSSLVSRPLSQQEIVEKCRGYNLQLQGEAYVTSIIRIDRAIRLAEGIGPGSNQKLVNKLSLRETDDQQLQLFAVLNIVTEMIREHSRDQAFIHHDDVVLLSVYDDPGAEQAVNSTLKWLEEIRFSVERFLKLSVTVGVGTARSSLSDSYYSYKEAMHALDYRLVLGGNKLIYIGDVESPGDSVFVFDELKEQELIRCLKVGSDDELRLLLEQMFGSLIDCRKSLHDFQLRLLVMLTAVIKAANDIHIDFEKLLGEGGGFIGQIFRFTHVDEARAWFTELCLKLKQMISSRRQTSYHQLVQQAKDYIMDKYSEQDISINKVCAHLHISTGYFSNIFKKETKLTFVNYLQNIRMEEAKNLLATTDMKSFEIAERVGFSDPNYFSFCFRKKYGLSPKDYRNGAQTV